VLCGEPICSVQDECEEPIYLQLDLEWGTINANYFCRYIVIKFIQSVTSLNRVTGLLAPRARSVTNSLPPNLEGRL
jgi:hypothetical protein